MNLNNNCLHGTNIPQIIILKIPLVAQNINGNKFNRIFWMVNTYRVRYWLAHFIQCDQTECNSKTTTEITPVIIHYWDVARRNYYNLAIGYTIAIINVNPDYKINRQKSRHNRVWRKHTPSPLKRIYFQII